MEIQNNIISVLVRLDHEAREAKNHPNSAKEIGKRGAAITGLLRKVENDFGSNFMLKVHKDASLKAGHTIGPLPGGGTRSESDGYVRPEMGGRKNDPYSDSKMTKEKTPLQ